MSLDEGQQRVVKSFLRSARNGGVALRGKEKERFNAIQLRLAELKNKFRWNVGKTKLQSVADFFINTDKPF